MAAQGLTDSLKRTALVDFHRQHGARMVAFAGYEMPLQYAGIAEEHLLTRRGAGLFDVSHMGQITVRARSGNLADAASALERVLPSDILGLPAGRQRYAVMTNDAGGIIDDLMIAHRGDHFLLIVNASRRDIDLHHLRRVVGETCEVEMLAGRSLLALQGPAAETALRALGIDAQDMRFLDVRSFAISGQDCVIARSGYTGEDGFELSLPDAIVVATAQALIKTPEVGLAGLGARDSLRLEAGLCLYGAELSEDVSPVAASLAWSIPKVRRSGGVRAGGFPGAARILNEIEQGARTRRIGLRGLSRVPVRAGVRLTLENGESVGSVTSGTFSPTLQVPIAMASIGAAVAADVLTADVRGRPVAMRVTPLPFVPHRYRLK